MKHNTTIKGVKKARELTIPRTSKSVTCINGNSIQNLTLRIDRNSNKPMASNMTKLICAILTLLIVG
jgi:hypothetical protein